MSSVSISGDFAETNTRVTATPTGSECIIDVTLTPQIAGSRSGSFTAIDTLGNTYIAHLSGTAVAAGAGATFSNFFTTGSAGAYTLDANVDRTSRTSWPTGSVSFVDTTAGNASLGTALLGAQGSLLEAWNGPSQPVGIEPSGVVTGDFNGDGKMDFAVANNGSTPCGVGSVSIWLGNGDGTRF